MSTYQEIHPGYGQTLTYPPLHQQMMEGVKTFLFLCKQHVGIRTCPALNLTNWCVCTQLDPVNMDQLMPNQLL